MENKEQLGLDKIEEQVLQTEHNTVNTEVDNDNVTVNSDDDIVVPTIDDGTELKNDVESGIPKSDNNEIDEDNETDEVELGTDYEVLSRNELASLLDELINVDDINEVKSKVALIRSAFSKANREFRQELQQKFMESAAEGEKFEYTPDDVESRFENLYAIYKQKKQSFFEEQEAIKLKNLDQKKHILERLKELIDSEEFNKKVYDEFRLLQDEWRKVGVVPKADMSSLWQSYHFLVERFFDKVKINNELRELDFKKNLEAKIELCEKAEELLLEESLNESFKKLQALHEKWKEIGLVANDKKDEIWERFKTATDKLNSRRQEYFDKKKDEFKANYDAKLALVEKIKEITASEILSIKDWQARTDEANEIFKLWKSIGRAPKEVNDEVWNDFKSLLNAFYNSKNDYFTKLKSEQLNNYNIKVDLCVQAEAVKDSLDWGVTSKELIRLQKEWKKVGPVPQRLSDKIWKRFRAACDEFFNAKTEFFSHINESEDKNLQLKKELIENVNSFDYSDDKASNLQVLKDFQRKWMEIGHVPIKDKDSIYKEFRSAVDNQMEKLGITSLDMRDSAFRSRVESLKGSPDGDRAISKEISNINDRISSMKDEIALWENNIEFFAKSKNSDLLRAEFEKKIEKSKRDVKVLELKLDFLRKELRESR